MQASGIELPSIKLGSSELNELTSIYRSILRHKLPIIGFTITVLLLTYSLLQTVTPIYRSSTQVMIEAQNAKVINVEELFNVGESKEYFNTQIEIIRSRETMLRVIKELKLWDVPEFDPRNTSNKNIFYKLFMSKMENAQSQNPKTLTDEQLADLIIVEFEKKMQAQPVKQSLLVTISFDSEDQKLAQTIANSIAHAYMTNDRDSKFKMASEINAWLNNRLEGLRAKLVAAESALQSYREKNGVVDVNGSVQSIDVQQIGGISEQLTQAKVKKAELEGAYYQISQIKNGDYSTVPAVMKDELVITSRKHESDVESQISEIRERYGSDHPKYIAAMSELKSAQNNTKTQMALAVNGLKREYEIASSTVSTLERALNGAKSSLQSVNRTGTQLGVLQRDVESNKQIYETFLNRAKETGSTTDLQTSVARVVDEAALGEKIKPRKAIILIVSFLISLLFGTIVAIWRERSNNTIKGPQDAENKIGVPILATLPIQEIGKNTNISRLVITEPDTLFAEGIRTANTGISLTKLDNNKKVILITSSVAGEGKTTFALNIALSFASTKKVLIIDGDMRRPNIAKSARLNNATKSGLANVLIGQIDLKSVLIKMPDSNLTILPAGLVPTVPLDLIGSDRFKKLIEYVKSQYDLVIIDSPPVGLVSDAIAYLPLVDAVIYVVKCMDTHTPIINRGIKQILTHGTDLIGVVLNQLDFKIAQLYYGEYSPYSKYGFKGYGYNSVEDRKEPA